MKKVLTIAGSDSSGGAGIQADLKTMTAHRVYGMSVITALTAQNTTGVFGIMDASPEFVAKEIDCVFEDIRPDAVKVGMVSNAEIIKTIAEKLKFYKAVNIVVDPVMVSTSGSRLLSEGAASALMEYLLPEADIITPNIPEAEALCGSKIKSKDDMLNAAKFICGKIETNVLIKGGHFEERADDLLYMKNGGTRWYKAAHIETKNTHGTGCTLSSAIACGLAEGLPIEKSIEEAKRYITGAISNTLGIGRGCGPLNHMWNITVNG